MLKLKRMPDYGMIDRCQQAFITALDRREKTGACAFKADELAAVREVAEVYGDLLKEITHSEFAAACAHTNANISRVLREKKCIEIGGCRIDGKHIKQPKMEHSGVAI